MSIMPRAILNKMRPISRPSVTETAGDEVMRKCRTDRERAEGCRRPQRARLVSGKDRMNRAARTPLHVVIAGLDPAIMGTAGSKDLPMNLSEPDVSMDHRVIGERSDAVLQTAVPGGDEQRKPHFVQRPPPSMRRRDKTGAQRFLRQGGWCRIAQQSCSDMSLIYAIQNALETSYGWPKNVLVHRTRGGGVGSVMSARHWRVSCYFDYWCLAYPSGDPAKLAGAPDQWHRRCKWFQPSYLIVAVVAAMFFCVGVFGFGKALFGSRRSNFAALGVLSWGYLVVTAFAYLRLGQGLKF
jgi:hypothetical protein